MCVDWDWHWTGFVPWSSRHTHLIGRSHKIQSMGADVGGVALDLATLGQTNRQINLSPCQGDISIGNCCAILSRVTPSPLDSIDNLQTLP